MNDRIRIVLVGKDEIFSLKAARWLESQGHAVFQASTLREARQLCEQSAGEVIVCDLTVSEDIPSTLLQWGGEGVPVVVVGGVNDADKVASAVRCGAADYLCGPFTPEDLSLRCRLASRYGSLQRENRRLKPVVHGHDGAAAPLPLSSLGLVEASLGGRTLGQPANPDIPSLAAVERQHILDVLRSQRGNKARTAVVLGIHRRKLYRLLDRLQISRAER